MVKSVGSGSGSLSLSTLGVSSHGVVGKVKDVYDKMMFGVLYSMVHGNTFSRKFLVLNLVVEFVQLLSFCFRAVFPWQTEMTYLGFSLSFFRLPDTLFSYQAYTVVFWLVFVFVWLSIGNAILVGYGFHHEAYRFIWSIRTLRWVTSVLVSVLYIPVVIIFLTTLACSPGGSTLSYFSSESIPCWGSANAIKYVASVITLVVFTPFAFSNCSTYYEHDPTVKFTYGRAHSRFDVVMLALKTAWTISFAFGETLPWVLCVILVLGVAIALMTSLVYMPMYNHLLNQMKTCSLAVVLWGSFSVVICLALNDRNNHISTYFFIAGIVPAFGAGYFLYRWRVKSLRKICDMMTNPQSYDVEAQSPSTKSGSKTTKVVTWATPAPAFGMVDAATLEAAAAKLHFSNEVELVARFVLAEEPVTSESIQQAEIIYRAGIKRFPRSAVVLMSFIIFLMVYKRDTQRGFALLEKLRRKGSGYFDIRFFIFRQDKDRERKVQLEGMGGEKGKFDDFVGYMQYQKLYTQARQGHLEVLKLVQKFWKLLLEENVDMARLAGQAGKIATAEEKTEKLYLTLLNLYPQSPRLLRDFAQFVDDILQEEDLVRFLVERADYFEETASKSRSKSPRKRNLNFGEEEEESEDKARVDDDLFDEKSMLTSSADLSQSSLQRKKMAMLNKGDTSSLKILSAVLIGCTIISIMLAMIMVVTTTNQIDQYNHDLTRVVSASLLSALGGQLAVDARTSVAHARVEDTGYTYAKDQKALSRRSIIYKNMVQAIAWGQDDLIPFATDTYKQVAGLVDNTIDIGSRVFSFADYNVSEANALTMADPQVNALFYDPSIDIIMTTIDSNGEKTEETYRWGFWAAGRLFSEYGSVVGNFNYSQLINIHQTSEEYSFVALNGGLGINDGLTKMVDTLSAVANDGLWSVVTLTFVTYAIACFVTIVTGIAVFRPVVLKVVSQKSHTLNLFLKVPPEVVQKMVRRNGHLIKSFKVSLDGPQLVADTEGEFAIEENEPEDDEDLISASNCKVVEETGVMLTTLNPLKQTNDSTAPLLGNSGNNEPNNNNAPQITSISGFSGPGSGSGSSGAGSARMPQRSQNNQKLTRGFYWLHASYALGLLFILICFSALLMAILFTFDDVNPAAHSLNLAAARSRTTKSISNSVLGFLLPETRNISREMLKRDILTLIKIEQDVESLVNDLGNNVGLEDLYTTKCLVEGVKKCTPETSPYYDDVSQGMAHLIYAYVEATKRVLTYSDAKLTNSIFDADINWIISMGADDLAVGGHRFTRQLALYWGSKISSTKQVIGGIAGLVIFLFIVEYFAFFRTLLSRLKNESQNTYAMLQMIPKKELQNIRELFEITNV